MDVLKPFAQLPNSQRVAWLILLLIAVVLAGLGIITLKDATSLLQGLTHLPLWQKVGWTTLGALAVGMTYISTRTHARQSREAESARVEGQLENLSARLESLSRKMDLLLMTMGPARVVVGKLDLPAPAPERRIGWADVVVETTAASSVAELDAAIVEQIFESIVQNSSLVNAVLAGRVAIERIVLDSPVDVGYQARIEIRNQTAAELALDVPRGQVFENADRTQRVQNLATSSATTIRCKPGELLAQTLPAYCLNVDRDPPSGQAGNITPLRVKFAFADQNELWDRIKEITKA